MGRLDEIAANVDAQDLKDGDCYYAEFKDIRALIDIAMAAEHQVSILERYEVTCELREALAKLNGEK